MKRTKVMVVVWLGLVSGFGCGEKLPWEKCEDLVSEMCDRIVECFSDAAGMHARCVDEFQSVLTCSSVQSVGSSYDDCMDQLDSRSCRTLFPTTDSGGPRLVLPDACNGVLTDDTSRQSAAATHWLNTPLSNLLDGMVDVTGGDGLSPRP